MTPAPAAIRPVLVINCVTWGPEYDPAHPLYDVGEWFHAVFIKNGAPVTVEHSSQLGGQDKEDVWPRWEDYSALVLTGSPSSAYDQDEWIRRLKDLVREAVRASIPTLGICFGSQLIASALGGEVHPNPKGWELGNHEVHLTPEGARDPVFKGFPRAFTVMESHQDEVTALPPGAVTLATNQHSPVQAYALGETLRAVQFHPEMGPEHMRFILPPRRERIFAASGIDVSEVITSLRPTPIALRLFRNFVNHFVTGR